MQKNLNLNKQEISLVSSLQSKKREYSESFIIVGDDKAVIKIYPSDMEYKIANSEANVV